MDKKVFRELNSNRLLEPDSPPPYTHPMREYNLSSHVD